MCEAALQTRPVKNSIRPCLEQAGQGVDMKPSTAFTNSACRDTLAAPGLALAGTGALAMAATPSDMLANYSAQAGGAALAERGQ